MPDALEELRATLERAAVRKPWIGDHGFYLWPRWESSGTFYWFREDADMRRTVAVIERANRDARGEDEDELHEPDEPFGTVDWAGPIEDLMRSRHEVAESTRYWFWLSIDRFAWPFTLEADDGWSMFLVRPVSEDELAGFGEFLADPGPLWSVPWWEWS